MLAASPPAKARRAFQFIIQMYHDHAFEALGAILDVNATEKVMLEVFGSICTTRERERERYNGEISMNADDIFVCNRVLACR